MASLKTAVIEWIFFSKKFDSDTRELREGIVTFADIVEGISEAGNGLSNKNTANFWKDLTRSDLNLTWPDSVLAAGFTGRDAIGRSAGACFEFVPLPPGQQAAFVDVVRLDRSVVLAHRVQSLSMPRTMKVLGRRDENWLAQVAARLNIVETHFAIFSRRPVLEVAFLQTGVKLRQGETDSAYSVVDDQGLWLLSVEAKGRNDSLHLPQISRAATSLASTAQAVTGAVGVIPFALKIVGDSEIHSIEFAPVQSADEPLVVESEGLFIIEPRVPGIS